MNHLNASIDEICLSIKKIESTMIQMNRAFVWNRSDIMFYVWKLLVPVKVTKRRRRFIRFIVSKWNRSSVTQTAEELVSFQTASYFDSRLFYSYKKKYCLSRNKDRHSRYPLAGFIHLGTVFFATLIEINGQICWQGQRCFVQPLTKVYRRLPTDFDAMLKYESLW